MYNNSIEIKELGKMYKLYEKNSDKFADAFGLGKIRKINYQEFWALRNINLEIRKGERLGIIGRNGAGKSTLLKCILGNITPTEGSIFVNGKIQALMELGTGFHPEFTGRDNIKLSLAYQQLSNREINRKIDEIIDFAELGEFIDQPIKSYSAGMYARLAFSTATSVIPEILIIDEVLGAGDAYFASKCVDKMKELTSKHGATVLFVSHDMSSVEMLCDSAIWIERGTLIQQGRTIDISKGYSKMTRERTEKRLKAKNSLSSQSMETATLTIRESNLQFIVRLVTEDEGIRISKAEYIDDNSNISVDVGLPQDTSYDYEGFVLIDNEFSRWGAPESKENYASREVRKSSAVVFNLDGINLNKEKKLKLHWLGMGRLNIQVFDGENYVTIGSVKSSENNKLTVSCLDVPIDIMKKFLNIKGIISLNDSSDDNGHIELERTKILDKNNEIVGQNNLELIEAELDKNKIQINSLKILNMYNQESAVFNTFDSMVVEINYTILEDNLEMEFVVCIHRMGIIALQSISGIDSNLICKGKKGETKTIKMNIPKIHLGKGTYFLSVGIFPPLDYSSLDTEKTAYILLDRKYEIQIEQPEKINMDLGMCRHIISWET